MTENAAHVLEKEAAFRGSCQDRASPTLSRAATCVDQFEPGARGADASAGLGFAARLIPRYERMTGYGEAIGEGCWARGGGEREQGWGFNPSGFLDTRPFPNRHFARISWRHASIWRRRGLVLGTRLQGLMLTPLRVRGPSTYARACDHRRGSEREPHATWHTTRLLAGRAPSRDPI